MATHGCRAILSGSCNYYLLSIIGTVGMYYGYLGEYVRVYIVPRISNLLPPSLINTVKCFWSPFEIRVQSYPLISFIDSCSDISRFLLAAQLVGRPAWEEQADSKGLITRSCRSILSFLMCMMQFCVSRCNIILPLKAFFSTVVLLT